MLKKGLVALAFGGFAIGMTEFAMMGITTNISADLNVTINEATLFIALYALGVVIGAPTLVLLASKYPPKKVLIAFMITFFVFNGLFSIAPDLFTMKLSRFLAGLPHGAFFGVGSVVATKLADKGKEASAIAFMFTGMTIANLIGVPVGTYIAQTFSWRTTYLIISFTGLITALAIYFWLPTFKASPNQSMSTQLPYFKRVNTWLIIALISIGTGGLFAWISYIDPLVTYVSGIDPSRLPIIMALIGLGMFIGNILGGKLADAMKPSIAAMICFSMMAVCLIVVYFTSPISWTAYPMAFITGLISFTTGSPLQLMLIRDAKGYETIAAAGGQASFNIGNTLGAYIGGIPLLYGFAYNTPLLVGVVMASIGVLLTFTFYKLYVKK